MKSKHNLGDRTQAGKVFKRFGNPYRLHKALQAVGHLTSLTNIYRWNQSLESPNGTGGLIPNGWIHRVLEAARFEGIELTSEDLDPREGV